MVGSARGRSCAGTGPCGTGTSIRGTDAGTAAGPPPRTRYGALTKMFPLATSFPSSVRTVYG